MKKVIITALAVLFALALAACSTPAQQPQETVCDHYDMDMDNCCDECGEVLAQETEPVPSEAQPDYGAVTMHLSVEYTLGAYSSGTTTMNLYDSFVATVDSIVDTSAVGQGEQHINEIGTWSYNEAEDTYTLDFDGKQYILGKNAEGLFSVQYSFVMRGQTGGSQDISVILVEDRNA